MADYARARARPLTGSFIDVQATYREWRLRSIHNPHGHTFRPSMDSDVLYECLTILPQLAPGVLVHFHDILTPLDYPEKFVTKNLCFWGEQYLLEAFLSFNSSYEIVWSASAMQNSYPDVLRRAFPDWEGSFERMPAELNVFAPSLDAEGCPGELISSVLS
jgi:hypothetical protein